MVELHALVLLVLCVVVNCAVLRGTAFFCRDPDTGKFYAVNTTWASSSFCGNYTCKLRRRSTTVSEESPIRQINITNIENHGNDSIAVTIEKKSESDVIPLLHKNSVPDSRNTITEDARKPQSRTNENIPINPFEENGKYKPKLHNCKMESRDPKSNGDRYLTEKEIDNIAELLHTIKKSDLDALVDIYNLAQDIYKEMEEASDKEIMNEALHLIQEEERHRKNGQKPASYWLNTLDNKVMPSDRSDMAFQSSKIVHSTAKPKSDGVTYFNGALTSNDFGKIPYYYPLQFQRLSSYTQAPAQPKLKILKINTEADRKKLLNPTNKNNDGINPENSEPKSQKLIQPSHLLPYPFTNIRQNSFNDSSYYISKNPWLLDYYNRYTSRYYQPYQTAYIAPIHKAVLVNPHLSGEVQVIEQKPVHIVKKEPYKDIHEKIKAQPSWKTKPLSIEVLKDIRADIDTTKLVKAFPLRKKIKLERAGRLINVDELTSHLNRKKRAVDSEIEEDKRSTEQDEYETYLEKITCQDQVEPGYFRVGNMNEPYPNCCPQKINTR